MPEATEYDELAEQDADDRYAVIRALANRRIELGLTQKEVAESMGMQQATISRYENGAHLPDLRQMQRYARALGGKIEIRLTKNP